MPNNNNNNNNDVRILINFYLHEFNKNKYKN